MERKNVTKPGFIIQAAGVLDLDEALMLARCGATHLGFPLGPGVRTPDMDLAGVAEVAGALPEGVAGVAITYLDRAGDVRDLVRAAGLRAVQLHAPVSVVELARLRVQEPDWFIIKSLVVGRGTEEDVLTEMRLASPHVNAFLTDTFDPETGASGATGKPHDWAVSRTLARAGLGPVILAGGLNPDNVARAVRAVRPAGVDAHTGLERADGRKDEEKTALFVSRASQAVASFSEAL